MVIGEGKMENKFLGIMIIYVIIASSAIAIITEGEYLTTVPIINEEYNTTDSTTLSQLVVAGDYKIHPTYGIYSDSIEKLLNYPTNPLYLKVPVLKGDYGYISTYKIYNPYDGMITFTFKDFLSSPLYQVIITGNDITLRTNEEEEVFIDVLPESYTLSIEYDIDNKNFLVKADGFTGRLTISEPIFKVRDKIEILIADNYVYLAKIKVSSEGENTEVEDVNPLTQLILILAWNVEGLPLALNLIFIKVPILCIAIGIFQLARGN